MSTEMVLIQLLLPQPRASDPDDGERDSSLARTRDELTEHFSGLTAYTRSPARGVWTAPDGATERDDVVMIEVVAASFDRSWWRQYVNTLERRFHQARIHVRAVPIEMLDEEGA